MFTASILQPIEWVVAWILYAAHRVLSMVGVPSDTGVHWILSISILVLVIRIALIPLFVKQIESSRRMQLAQPHFQKLQKKYKDKKDPASLQAMRAEQQELMKEHGNPLASCLPILLQMPIFFSLFNVLRALKPISEGNRDAIGPISEVVAKEAEASTFFGSHLSDSFLSSDQISTKVLAMVLVVLMIATQFWTQKQMMSLNMPPSALTGPMAQQQKMLLYVLPVVMGVTGFGFPLGVIWYWFVSNLFTTAQQYYVLHNMPAPGSEAERRLNAKRAAKGLPPVEVKKKKRKDRPAEPKNKSDDVVAGEVVESEDQSSDAQISTGVQPRGKQRQQPSRKKKRK